MAKALPDDVITGVDESDRRLGNAQVISHSDAGQGKREVEAGVSAIAYDVLDVEVSGEDEIVISYRGSDYDPAPCGDIWLGRESNGRRPLRGRLENVGFWRKTQ